MVKRFLYDAKYHLWIRPYLWWRDTKVILNIAFLALIGVIYLIPRGYILTKRENNEKIISLSSIMRVVRSGLYSFGTLLRRNFENELST